jgi:hypothetical protein
VALNGITIAPVLLPMTFQFKIQLLDVRDPEVWRRMLVPASFS